MTVNHPEFDTKLLENDASVKFIHTMSQKIQQSPKKSTKKRKVKKRHRPTKTNSTLYNATYSSVNKSRVIQTPERCNFKLLISIFDIFRPFKPVLKSNAVAVITKTENQGFENCGYPN